jgi:hypothetical protein
MQALRQTTIAAVTLLLLTMPAMAQNSDEQGKHCPDSGNVTRFFETADSNDQDHAKLDLVSPQATASKAVCILAFVDPNDTGGYTRKLAIRRIKWLLDGLTAHGVPRQIMSWEFRPAADATDKAAMRHVEVILGR